MEFDLSWVLLGFPFVFALGWWASRIDWRQWRLENSQAPRAYFKGLNFLLNEQQDQAIDAFIEAVQKDPKPTTYTLRWAASFATGANLTAPFACTSTCSRAPICPATTASAPATSWRWTS